MSGNERHVVYRHNVKRSDEVGGGAMQAPELWPDFDDDDFKKTADQDMYCFACEKNIWGVSTLKSHRESQEHSKKKTHTRWPKGAVLCSPEAREEQRELMAQVELQRTPAAVPAAAAVSMPMPMSMSMSLQRQSPAFGPSGSAPPIADRLPLPNVNRA